MMPVSFRQVAVAALILAPGLADAKTIYVNAAKPSGGDGTSWTKAFKYLRDALDVSIAGDVLFLAEGVYYPDDGKSGYYGDRELSFEVDGLTVYGGFAGTETSIDQRDVAAHPTILSGEIWPVTSDPATAGYQRYWSLHVVVLRSSATFDGLTIERGRANGDEAPYNQGGGVLVTAGALTLRNCSVNECLAAQDGGAVFGNVIATDSTFVGNRSDNEFLLTDAKLNDPVNTQHAWLFSPDTTGGAITGNVTATNCQFLDNHVRAHSLVTGFTSSAFGGAISGTTISVRDCVFDGNTADASSFHIGSHAYATVRGGAIAGATTAVNCVFTNNQADTRARANTSFPPVPYICAPQSFGGAIAGQIGATNCVFADNAISSEYLNGDVNLATSYGGAVHVESTSDMLNCVLVRNDATSNGWASGGGIRASETSVIPVANCTFLDNTTNTPAFAPPFDINATGTCLSVGGNVKILSNIFWDTFATQAVAIWVDSASNGNAKARISNRLYPTPSTETINIVKGGLLGVDVNFSNADLGDPPERTLLNKDPLFAGVALPEGPDGIWKTSDDGLRLTSTSIAPSPAVGIGHPLFLPTDKFDLDEDGNITETSPVDVANYARIQDSTLDLGAYEFGDILRSPEIQVEHPAGVILEDGEGFVSFGTALGVPMVKTFVIKNTGTLPLKGLSIIKSGSFSNDFTVSQPLKTTVGANTTTTFKVTLLPTSQGLKTATIRIASNDADENPFDIDLQGQTLLPDITVEQPRGNALVDGASLINYGTVAALSSSTKVFTIRNDGFSKLNISDIPVSGNAAADFKVSGPALKILLPGEEAIFRVAFSPTARGTRNAKFTIQSNDPDSESTFVVNLTGNGIISPEIAVYQPASLSLVDGGKKSFGDVKKGLSYTKEFTIKNVGSDKLKDIGITLSGSGAFTKSKLNVTSLNPGASTKITVTFKPSSTGKKEATLRIASNDKDESPFDIKLVGTGISGNNAKRSSSFAAVAGTSALSSASATSTGVVTTTRSSDGLEYLVLTVEKPAVGGKVEVSSNLVDWFSGGRYTTTLVDDAEILRVRDNTPVTKGGKRYIRLK